MASSSSTSFPSWNSSSGNSRPFPDLPPQDAQNRFQMVFRRFLGVFARKEHPLALFLDDLQWLDAATLELLEHLFTDPEVRHLLLVGAYRDNEVDPSHPLLRTLAAIRKAGASVQEIVLAPLGLDDMGRLVADALHCDAGDPPLWRKLVHEKTGGNPFFAIQFLTALAEEGCSGSTRSAAALDLGLDRIRAKGYTDNVVDLMVGKLKRLSATTQAALKQLACLGNVAEIATLALVHGNQRGDPRGAAGSGPRRARLRRRALQIPARPDPAGGVFTDSRRAARQHAPAHWPRAAGERDGGRLAEHLFDVANQFNRGAALLVDHDEKVQVATLDLRAGRKAKASAAYASARAYFSAGMALLDERDWSSQYELTFSLWLERAECELLSGNFEKAEQLIVELLRARGVESRPGGRLPPEGPVAYREVGIPASRRQRAHVPAPVWHRPAGTPDPGAGPGRIRDGLANPRWAPDRELIDLPLMTDPELQAAMQVLSVLLPPPTLPTSVCLLAGVPHGEDQHAARDERRFRARLWLLGGCARAGLSPLPRGLSFRQACLRPGREARLHRDLARDLCLRWEASCLLDAADRDRDRFHAADLSRRD
jgi:hypothetical protein